MTALPAKMPWLAGLGNQTRREAAMWWSTGRWRRQALVWTLVLGGLLAAMLWVLPAVFAGIEGAEAMTDDVVQVAAQFAELAAFVSAVGVVILTQGLLLDDQRSGLTEWLLSKPLSRPGLLVAKLFGHSSGLLVSVVLIPWAAVYALLSRAAGAPWPMGRFVATVALIGVFVIFHVALVLALSALTGSRGVVLAVPLALLVGADLVVTAAPWMADGMPYLLNRVAAALLATGELAAVGPPLAAVAGAVVLAAVAVWRFAQQEL
jgi:ABC-type transport system involved in multi-copper enzyme maturation permease subunit